MSAKTPASGGRGRPPSTSKDAVAQAALGLFAIRGFEETTVEEIAATLGVGRRTVFRYFASKNDMVWGDFDVVIDRLRADLAAQDPGLPVMRAVALATASSNRYPPEAQEELRMRLSLITTVPALQAHSMLRYAAWRAVVAEYAGRRRGEDPSALFPQTIAFAALAVAISAFSHWVHHGGDLETHLLDAFASLDTARSSALPASAAEVSISGPPDSYP